MYNNLYMNQMGKKAKIASDNISNLSITKKIQFLKNLENI